MLHRPGSNLRHSAHGLEALEKRTLLSAALPGSIPAPIAKLPAGTTVNKLVIPSTYGGKLESDLWSAIQPILQKGASKPNNPARYDSRGNVEVNIQFNGSSTVAAMAALRKIGIHVQAINKPRHLLQVWVKPSQMQAVTSLSIIRSVQLPNYGIASTGAVDTQGDALLNADKVRQQFAAYGIDGTGIKVGVISSGVDERGLIGDDLPDITIDPLHPGSGDEGTAMLEIVHDLAPGAQLYFSGPATNLDMVDSINYMRSQGVNVIVDDLAFPGEPYFQDGVVEQAAQAAVDNGIVYVSAAGNFGTPAGFFGITHYQHQFVDDGTGFHNFLDGAGVDVLKEMLVINNGGLDAVLQWSDPFGAASDDYDLYLFNSSFQVIAASADFQTGTQDPIESFEWVNNTGVAQVVRLAIVKYAGADRELEMLTFGVGSGAYEYNTPGDSIFGQQAAPGVIAVTAVDANDPGTDTVEQFASQGPSTIYTNFATQTKVLRNSLDGAAVDGVETHVGQAGFFFDPFYGTSAAAPHAAAIAALMLQANPTLTPGQVAQDMQDTATDLTAYGVGYDQVSGAGLFNALDAVFKVFTPTAPDLDSASDHGVSSTDNITNVTSPTFDGLVPAGSFVSLYIDNVLDQSVQLGTGVTNYSLIAGTPLSDGNHTVTVRVASSASVPDSDFSNTSPALVVHIDTVGIADPTPQFLYDTGQALQLTFSEDVSSTFHNGDVIISDLTHGGTISTNTFFINPTGVVTFVVPGGILADGNYHAHINASSVTDTAGNPMSSNVDYDFFVLAGDANRDRKVDGSDILVVSVNWQQTGKTFSQGDFNYDGTVDARDLGLLALNWQMTLLPA